ncbi:MAG TPA: TlpA disulfide reductase family protein [Gemmatimonadales bacterium]|nr:TlpA disulfide reductase family protein [Gemmatimonadales bacterium]
MAAGPILALALQAAVGTLAGPWRGALDLAGGPLPFQLEVAASGAGLSGRLCNASACGAVGVRAAGDSVTIDIPDFDARLVAAWRGDSLAGEYRNVGNRGPRTIPFRAERGRWPPEPPGAHLAGSWDAWFEAAPGRRSPRVIRAWRAEEGGEGTVIGNSGDSGLFLAQARGDSLILARFDGSFVYLVTARLDGDTLRGTWHAGLRSQTPFTAVRTTGRPHLRVPTEITRADTAPFRFAFPDLEGRIVTQDDPRFRGKVLLVDVFGTWCPTCHDAAPVLVGFDRDYRARGLAIVGLAYEVTGDSAVDNRQLRRYREKFGIEFPLLRAGLNDTELTAATLPQLANFTAYPTTLFLDRRGRVRRVQAGFYGPATGAQHERLVAEFRAEIERLLAEP